MNKKLIISVLAISLLVLVACNQEQSGEAYKTAVKDNDVQPVKIAAGSMFVNSTPINSSIYLNNIYKGTAPLSISSLNPQTYNVTIKHVGYYDWSQLVLVKSGKTSFVNAYLQKMFTNQTNVTLVSNHTNSTTSVTGSLFASSKPSVASVYVDNKSYNVTPINITGLSMGQHSLTLKKSGYYIWSQSIYIKSGLTTFIQATLTMMNNQSNVTLTNTTQR